MSGEFAQRLGVMLFWALSATAVLFVLAAIRALVFFIASPRGQAMAELLITGGLILLAVLSYIFGRACRYALAGR